MDTTQSTATPAIHVPVLVVGAGPAGLTASLALSRYGVRHLLVDRYDGSAHTPRAHLLNQRTGEIFRDLGVEDRVLAEATPSPLFANHVFMSTFAGPEVSRLDAYGNGPDRIGDYLAASPGRMCNLAQHLLEPILVDEIERARVGELRGGQDFQRLTQDDDGVTAVLRDRHSGQEYTVRADYVIGADGARSRVREQAGIGMQGHEGIARVASVWFEADLSRYSADRPAILYIGGVPGRPAGDGRVFVSIRPWNEWVYLRFLDHDDDPEGFSADDHEEITAHIRQSIGDPSIDIRIKSVSPWQVNAQVAERFAAGRVFCVGDAVHQMPPTNGLGLNTAVADAHNLAWKLRLVLAGLAGPELLATYETERLPVGGHAVDRAVRSMLDFLGIPAALGYEEGQSAEEQWALLRGLHDDTPEAAARREALAAATDRINGQVNAHGMEIGHRYRAGARVDDGTPEPAQDRDPELYYQATTWPGARLPHAWLEDGRLRCSTLDLVGHGRFVLLTGRGGEAWHEAAREAARLTGVEVTVRPVGTAGGPRDPYGTWERLREVDADGGVLVRPDGHVAWRAASSASAQDLPKILATLLHTPSGR
ncbi:FAD-dependent monooxygenase [Streptomyces phaeofaciens JCM 4814]|uniref:2,4-dichlorophenol 6-monooxygenase n=1 Tax=Streptomyces phaeofaciens TaxID=68254 RepID=A0A918LV57_9ACTN|nr:FAD-dependent monooxygenase [Streptomyces phaeofaciens]GGT58177.1 2,4-dichlorophenol 6-monooxygenase [Streptomyces phaeofaciens]